MGFPKKISQFPINPDLTGQDLLVTVNEFDVTSRINLQQLRDFVIDGKDNTFVTGGTVTEEAELILFRNDGLSFTIDLNPALSNTITGAENIPGGEGLIYSGKTNNELLLRSISGGENVIVETLGNTIQIGVEIPPDTNTFVTGATLTDDNNLLISRNDGVEIDVSLESLAEDIYVESASLDGTTYTLTRNDGVEIPTNLSTVVSGTVTTALFDSYTATTKTDIDSKLGKVEFNIYSATTKTDIDSKLNEVEFNTYSANTKTDIDSKLDISTFDSYTANTSDIYVSGGTLSGTDLILERTDDDTVNIDLSALSGVTQNSFVTGFTYDNKNNLTISRNDGLGDISTNLSEMSGLTINGDLTVTGDTQIDGRLTVEDQTWFKGSPITFGNSFADSIDFTGRINGNFVPVNDNTSDMGKPTTLSAQKYWRNFYVYNITGGTLNLFNTPTLNNSGTEILVRNTSTGQIDYRDVTTLSGSPTDTFVTGMTYNSTSNTVTLTQNESGPTQSVVIDSFSGVTLNGPTSINGNTIVDGDVLITKNVVILGTATTINSSTFSVDDNIITLNANATGSTVPLPIDSGIDILRNSGDTAVLLWEELNGYWAAGLSGATEPLIVNGINLGGGTSVFKQRNENVLDFNTLSGGTNVTLTSVGDIVRFDVPDNTNTFITGATLNGNTLEIERNDGVDVPVDLTSLVSGKLDISTFDSYTANTSDIYVSGGTLSGTDLVLNRTDGGVVTVDLSALSGVTQNTFVTGFTYNDNNVLSIKDNENNIYSTIINEMSGLTITSSGSSTSDTVFLVQDSLGNNIIEGLDNGKVHVGALMNSPDPSDPTLLIGAGKSLNDRGSLAFTSTGIGIGGDNDATGDYLLFRMPTSTGSRWRFDTNSNFGYTLVSRQNNNFGSGAGLRNSFYTSRTYGIDFLLGYNNLLPVADTVGYRFNTKDSTSAGANDVERFIIENGANETKSYFTNLSVLGVGTSNPDTNVRLHISGDTLINGTLTADTITISDTPILNNSGTEVLVRNSSTGEIEYRESDTLGTITGATNVTTTGLFKQINGKDLEFKGIQSSGGTVTITTDANTVNLESTSSGGNTVNSATKVFNWFMTIT